MFKKFRKEIIATALIILLCCLAVIAVDAVFMTEEGEKQAEVALTGEDQFEEGYIQINAHVIGVDPINEHLRLELDFIPHGKFDEGDGLLATQLEIDVSSAAHDELIFQAGKRMFPVEVELDFYEGEVEEYPFDAHRALLELVVFEEASADGDWRSVPTELDFLGHHHGYVFEDILLPFSKHGYIGFDVHVERSPLVLGTAIFLMLTMWGLTLVNLTILVAVLMGRMKADFSLFGYMSGFIVAMYFYRKIFPDIPDFLGVFSDYMAFFWAVLTAALIANVVAVKWIISIYKDDDPSKLYG